MGGALVRQVLIETHQIHVQLDAVERALGRLCGQAGRGGTVFTDGIQITLLELRNLSTDCVQAIVIGIESSGAQKK